MILFMLMLLVVITGFSKLNELFLCWDSEEQLIIMWFRSIAEWACIGEGTIDVVRACDFGVS